MNLGQKASENIMGKEENAGNQHFLHFPQFSTLSKENCTIRATLKLLSSTAFSTDKATICLVKDYTICFGEV